MASVTDMKPLLAVLFIAVLLASCAQSPESKATGRAVQPVEVQVKETTVCTEDVATAQGKLALSQANLNKYQDELEQFTTVLTGYVLAGSWDEVDSIRFEVEKYTRLALREQENIEKWQVIVDDCTG